MSVPHPLSDSELVVTASHRKDSTNSVPFPSPDPGGIPTVPSSESSTSELTSSDKLTALPAIQSSPALGLHRNSLRNVRRSVDATVSLPSLDSSPGMAHLSRLPAVTSRTSESEGSHGKETPKQRVSFDSDRGTLPAAVQNLRQAAANRAYRADSSTPVVPSPSGRSADSASSHPRMKTNFSPRGREGTFTSASPTQSRAASPLRFFGWNLHRNHSRDEPFIPVDPFELRLRFFASPTSTPRRGSLSLPDLQCEDVCHTCLPLPACTPIRNRKLRAWGWGIRIFFLDFLPRQMYIHALFRLPAMYFSRVSRIFEDAEISKHEVQRMIEACMPAMEANAGVASAALGPGLASAASGVPHVPQAHSGRRGTSALPFPEDWNPPAVSPAIARFKHSWEQFVDSLLREWKTLNLVSVLLCTALLTMFQIPDAAGDPVTRWAALFSLIFAIMSLTFGCIYIVQFGTMRTMYKASRWAEEAQKSKTIIFWNIWVLLAMPAIWLAWAMVAFCCAILSYIWRTGSSEDPDAAGETYRPLSPTQALIVRTVLTVVFAVGLIYFVLVVRTFGSYGENESDWRRSWLATGQPGVSREARMEEAERERERGRQRRREQRERERERERDRGSEHESKQHSPSIGLGLLGVSSSSANGLTSMTSVLQDEPSGEKGDKSVQEDVYVTEALSPRIRVSPKL